MSNRFRARGFRRIFSVRRAVSDRFDRRFLRRGLVNFAPFWMDLADPVPMLWRSSAPVSLRCRRRFQWTRLELFQVVAVALVCPQFIDRAIEPKRGHARTSE